MAKFGRRQDLYRQVAKQFNIRSALYPGSHIDIGPSLVIPNVIYVDNFKGTIAFFKNIELIKDYIKSKKEYSDESKIKFIACDYNDKLDTKKVDMIISQYAGFVGQATKTYLKVEGILLCNDSHGDATLAYCDDDFEFVGVVDLDNKIITTDLDRYFKFARKRAIDVDKVYDTMKGPKYKQQAENYIFRLKS